MANEQHGKTIVTPFLRQLFVVSGVVFYMIGTGANIAYPGVLLQQLREPDSAIQLSSEHESWIASILGLALMTGIATSPMLLEKLGRKFTNQLSTLPSLAGWAFLMIAKDPYVLLLSRFLQGFGMGIQASAAPVSIAEYSSPTHRGVFLATIAFSFSTGMLIAHIFGTLLHWRPAALACGSCYVLSLIVSSLSPETPSWLAANGHYDTCRKSFRWLRGNDIDSEKELEILISSQKNRRNNVQIANQNSKKVSTIRYFFEILRKREFYKPTLIMVFLFVMFQISGITVIPSYSVPIMLEVTRGKLDGCTAMLLVDFVRFASSILACFVVNKFKRRSVLFFGASLTVISLILTSLSLYSLDYGVLPEEYSWISLVTLLVYIIGKTISILPIPWAVAGEIFPLAFRSIGSGISGMILSIMFFVVVKTAPTSFNTIGVEGTFLVYAISVAICSCFLYFLLPETKDRTLHEIEFFFKGNPLENDKTLENDKMLKLEEIEIG